MPFGKYKGELVGTMIEEDPRYVDDFLLGQTDFRLDEQALEYLDECR